MSNTGISVPVDYTSRDFSSLMSDLLNAIPTFLPEWTSTSPNDMGIALLELFAYVGDIDNFYIDRVANEAFLATAQQRSSVLNIAYLIDYAPQDATAASTVMTLTLNPNTPSFTLPLGAQFATQSSANQAALIFELAAPATIPANASVSPVSLSSTIEDDVTTPLTVVQGVTITSEPVGTSNGNPTQSFTLFNTGVIDGSVQVFVDEGTGPVPWQLVANLIDSGPYDAVFMLAVDANGVVYITFGDGTNGLIPNPSAILSSTYRIGGGAVSNVGANQIVVDLTGSGYLAAVSNPSPAVGGSDPETIPQIQANAPQSLTAAGRCVTVQDYASVALNLPGVAKARAVASVGTAVTLYIHPAGGPYMQSALEAQVTALAPSLTWGGAGPVNSAGVGGYLDSAKMAGTTITVLPAANASPPGYAITGVTVVAGETITVTSAAPAVVGQAVTIAGVAGITNVNGTWAVTAIGTGTFEVVVSVAPTGTYTAASGTASPTMAYVQVVITMAVNVLPQYNQNQTEQNILAAINTLMNFGAMNFGQMITRSSVYHAVQSVAGVDYLVISAMSRSDAAPGTLTDIVCGPSEIPVVYDPDTASALITVTLTGGL